MINLNLFTNDTYKLLKFLYDNQIQVKEDYYVVLSQQEIADIKAKVVNTQVRIKELED